MEESPDSDRRPCRPRGRILDWRDGDNWKEGAAPAAGSRPKTIYMARASVIEARSRIHRRHNSGDGATGAVAARAEGARFRGALCLADVAGRAGRRAPFASAGAAGTRQSAVVTALTSV